MLCIGSTRLGYREEELFAMTPRKFFLLYNEYLIISGYKKDGDEYCIDNLP